MTIVHKAIAIISMVSPQITFILDDSTAYNVHMSNDNAQYQCRKWCILYVARQNVSLEVGFVDGCVAHLNCMQLIINFWLLV